jgi:hypothetical protein
LLRSYLEPSKKRIDSPLARPVLPSVVTIQIHRRLPEITEGETLTLHGVAQFAQFPCAQKIRKLAPQAFDHLISLLGARLIGFAPPFFLLTKCSLGQLTIPCGKVGQKRQGAGRMVEVRHSRPPRVLRSVSCLFRYYLLRIRFAAQFRSCLRAGTHRSD